MLHAHISRHRHNEMIHKTTVQVAIMASILFLTITSNIISAQAQVNAGMDKVLAEAEKGVKVIKISKDGSGNFKSVTDAIKSIPSGNTVRHILSIGPGEYHEKILVDRTRPFVTFYGSDPKNMPKLTYSDTAAKLGTWNSASVVVESDHFMAVNVIFQNAAPKPAGKQLNGEQAVAMRISGDKAAFYNCRFIGYQDTLCDDKGNHFFQNCYIEGTVDFVFGNGKSFYLQTELHSVAEGFSAITASMRQNAAEDTGFAFVQCKISGTGDIYLARTWKEKAIVVFAYTYMDVHLNPAGWFNNKEELSNKGVFYGEYKCSGPGASTAKRAPMAKLLTDAEAKPYLDKSYIKASTWLLPPPKI